MRCSSALVSLMLAAVAVGSAGAQEPGAIDARLAPDGLTVAARALDGTVVRVLAVEPYDSLAAPRWLSPEGVDVDALAWVPGGSRIVYRATDGHLYVVPAEGSAAAPPLDLTPDASEGARLAGFSGDSAALVELPGAWPGMPDLYQVSLTSGSRTLVRSNEGGVTRWVVDETGMPRMAVREGEEGERELARIRGDELVPVYVCGAADVCEVVGFHPDGRVWIRTTRDRLEPALVLADPLTLTVEVVRPELGVDAAAVIRDDSTYVRDVTRLQELLGDVDLAFLGPSLADAGRMLVSASDSSGAMLHVFDRWAGTVVPVLPLAGEAALTALAPAGPTPDPTLAWPERLRYLVSDGEPGVPPSDVRRRVERRTENGRPVLVITDETEVPVIPAFELDTTLLLDPAFEPDLSFELDQMETQDATDTVVLDAATLRPIRRNSTGPFSASLEYGPDGVRGTVSVDGFESRVAVATEGPVWADGSALELLVAALPLEEGYETALTYFDTSRQEVLAARLVVTGAARARTGLGELDAWAVTIESGAREIGRWTWLVRREAPHTLLRATVEARDYERTIELVEGRLMP